MCIIIDTNTLASVFDKKSANHEEFKPVFDWIMEGKGKVVYGGTKYLREITKYLALFTELRKIKKAVLVENGKVDNEETIAAVKIVDIDFDDQHIVGLLKASGCKLICSLDQRAYPFFRHYLFFSPASNRPKIYRGKRNRDLLIDRNIAACCLPCSPTTNAQRNKLKEI